MAKKEITFTVTPSRGIDTYFIDVGTKNVRFDNGKGSIDLQTGSSHDLDWRMTGDSGASLSIVGKDDKGN